MTAHYRLVQKALPIIQKSPVKKIVIIGSTSRVRKDKGGTFTEKRIRQGEDDRHLLETTDIGLFKDFIKEGKKEWLLKI